MTEDQATSKSKPGFTRKLVLTLLVAGVVAGLDLYTKKLAFEALLPPEKIKVIEEDFEPRKAFTVIREHARVIEVFPSWFNLRPGYNTGAVFGIGRENPVLIHVFTLVALCAIGYFIYECRDRGRIYFVSIGFILGGAVGNLVNRFGIGAVRDFIDWFIVIGGEERHWPTFNVADAFICVGIGILLVLFVKEERAEKKAAAEKASSEGEA